MITFTKVKLPYGWLGNMAPFPLVMYEDSIWKGQWRTPEALFQAHRFDNPKIVENIRNQTSPMLAKGIAKFHKDFMVISPMSVRDVDNMRFILKMKIDQHPELKGLLLQTKDEEIIEDCTARQQGSGLFWGAALKNGVWVGENQLGKLWMELREYLKEWT